MYIHQITEKWDIDLSAISNTGKTEKRFDYVIKTDNQIYVIETNCYTSGGSKLNELQEVINRYLRKSILLMV